MGARPGEGAGVAATMIEQARLLVKRSPNIDRRCADMKVGVS